MSVSPRSGKKVWIIDVVKVVRGDVRVPSFTYRAIGYHGCSEEKALVVSQQGTWPPSNKGWLGPGIYFWDNDKNTAGWWATRIVDDQAARVIRAEIDLSDCLDLTTVFAQNALRKVARSIAPSKRSEAALQNLEARGFTRDGALVHLTQEALKVAGRPPVKGVRIAVHLKEGNDTAQSVGTQLVAGFRMVIVVFDPSIIKKCEVCDGA